MGTPAFLTVCVCVFLCVSACVCVCLRVSVCVCVRQPGESWLLAEGCHTMRCSADRQVIMQSHKVSCDRLEPPACRNNMPPVRVQETCGCHWECQCERSKTAFWYFENYLGQWERGGRSVPGRTQDLLFIRTAQQHCWQERLVAECIWVQTLMAPVYQTTSNFVSLS